MAEDDNRAIPPAPLEPFDPGALHTYPLKSRPARCGSSTSPGRIAPGAGLVRLARASLPHLLAASTSWRSWRPSRGRGPPTAASSGGFGAHVVKTGLAPVVIDLMERGLVTALATNGAGIIHDFEIALVGRDL